MLIVEKNQVIKHIIVLIFAKKINNKKINWYSKIKDNIYCIICKKRIYKHNIQKTGHIFVGKLQKY